MTTGGTMKITIAAPHMDITPALSDTVHAKVQRLSKHSDREVSVHVVLTVDKNRHKAEMTVHGEGAPVVATAVEPDMYVSINKAAQMVDRQLRKRKTARLASRHTESIKKLAF